MLQDSLPQILGEIKAELLKNELFAKSNPDSQDIAKVTEMIADAMRLGARKILAEYLQDKQPKENALPIYIGETYFFKEVVSKTFLTRMGVITVARRNYRNKDGKTYVPLDASWGTDGEYSDPALREMVAFLAGSNTPTEIEEIFQRFMPVKPSQDYIRKIADREESVMETGEQVIQETAQQQEETDPQTKVVAASLDGVNVAVREKGTKARRPACRPKSVKKNASVTQKPDKKSAEET